MLPRPNPTSARKTRQGPSGARPPAPRRETNWIQWFIILQIICQLLLLTPLTTGPFRSLIRIAAFSISLLFLVILRGRGAPHPAAKPAFAALAILSLSLLNPDSSLVAGLAQIVLYLAILAPLFWIPRLNLDPKMFRSILLTFWAFYSLSAFFGVLQVYYPGRFQPPLSAVIVAKGVGYLKSLGFRLPNGSFVLRPMGLTDMPGGVAVGGFYAVLLGLGFLLVERRMVYRILTIVSMFLGMTCIYLSQVRSILVMLICCILVLFGVLVLRGSTAKLAGLSMAVGCVLVVSFVWAITMGGKKISDRLKSLTEDSPTQTYYKNRGQFLDYTIKEYLPKYPLGAGLGRWGMTNAYFGDHSKMIWVEIQWSGWLLDGGVPLVIAYTIVLAFAFKNALKIALRRDTTDLALWGAVVLAYDLGAFALTFDYPLFIGQVGMEFWVLNASLYVAARSLPTSQYMRWPATAAANQLSKLRVPTLGGRAPATRPVPSFRRGMGPL